MATEAGQVSVHFVNAAGSVLVAPFGGVDKRFSTAPFCVGVPRPGEAPLILDFATSVVAEGKVLVAAKGGKPVRSEEHTSELQSLMRISYAVFCLNKKTNHYKLL